MSTSYQRIHYITNRLQCCVSTQNMAIIPSASSLPYSPETCTLTRATVLPRFTMLSSAYMTPTFAIARKVEVGALHYIGAAIAAGSIVCGAVRQGEQQPAVRKTAGVCTSRLDLNFDPGMVALDKRYLYAAVFHKSKPAAIILLLVRNRCFLTNRSSPPCIRRGACLLRVPSGTRTHGLQIHNLAR